MKTVWISLCLFLLVGCASAEKKYATTRTAELKLRHAQILESLGYDQNQPDIDFLKPVWMRGPSRPQRLEEKETIERELLRRWQAGDNEAFLPIFGSGQKK